ncbi:MAG: hypothetical protein ABI175_22900 [Polyangiales bacterium]
MRWAAVLVLVGLVAAAKADPIAEETLLLYIWNGEAPLRAQSARLLAQSIGRDSPRALDIGRFAVISNDPKVRVPLLEALIKAKVIERASAVQIPTAAVLERRIRQLLPKDKPERLPLVTQCKVTGGTARSATIECSTSQCAGACLHEMRTLQITTGVRWKIEELQIKRIDDSSCGFCNLDE